MGTIIILEMRKMRLKILSNFQRVQPIIGPCGIPDSKALNHHTIQSSYCQLVNTTE